MFFVVSSALFLLLSAVRPAGGPPHAFQQQQKQQQKLGQQQHKEQRQKNRPLGIQKAAKGRYIMHPTPSQGFVYNSIPLGVIKKTDRPSACKERSTMV